MRKEHYVEILKQHQKTSNRKLKFADKWVFQMDNDPKHTAKLVTSEKLVNGYLKRLTQVIQFLTEQTSPLSLSSLRLLVPPLRLLTAAMWQVAEQQSVEHYGILEDFVSLMTEAVPQLLTDKQRSLLLLALRVKVSLYDAELQTDHQVHHNRIHSISVATDVFNQTFDEALLMLLSDFLARLEQLFPVPDFKRTASLLSAASAGLGDCLSVADREELKMLLTNQSCQLGQVTPAVDCDTEKILHSAWSHPLITKLTNPEPPLLSSQVRSDSQTDTGSAALDVEVTVMTEDETQRTVTGQMPSPAEAKSNLGALAVASVPRVNLEAVRAKDSDGNPSGHVSDQPGSDAISSVSQHSQRVAHKCPKCGKHFIYRSQVIRHLQASKSCASASATRITKCQADANTGDEDIPSSEAQHKYTRSSRSHLCFQCDCVFGTKVELQAHQRSHRARPVFRCGQCDKEFPHLSTLTNHKQTHKESSWFICSQCGKDFGSAKERDAHSLRHRPLNLTCTVCSQTFSSQSQLLRHLQTHSVEGAEPCYRCRFCEQTFSGVTLLRIHQRSHTTRSYQCDKCNKMYASLTGLQSHRASHDTDSRFLCPQCGKCFKTQHGLEGHLRTHSGERPYRCPYCSKDFTALAGLNVHVRQHTGERPYVCTFCGKGWPSGGDLQKHMRVHTGERPYTCQECGKSFSNSCHLSEHRRIHTGEKPFSCPECGKCLRRKFDLKKHLLCHSNNRPYACVSCPKSYTRRTHLNRHLLTHKPTGGEAMATDEV
ncbi:zinc finger protein ZFP2-like isoform X3 [Phycodurus eques]|uniref:zinc finger protein ZFP2-like isoform X3 n=1 Tax=Phycodurus eques TaxID=693459 RepID=UPI002ACE61F6|nr:zinc finger protein ZFP2-like isoform X3 [Phycodurus eques]